MDEIKRLIAEQKKDDSHWYIGQFSLGSIICPNLYRFKDFAGETPKEKAYSVLRYLGWNNYDIVSVLSLNICQLVEMQTVLNCTYKPENHRKFFDQIPVVSAKTKHPLAIHPNKKKAIYILKALFWTGKDVCSATDISFRTYNRIASHIKFARRASYESLPKPKKEQFRKHADD